jgi:phage terminase large subunit-like protein
MNLEELKSTARKLKALTQNKLLAYKPYAKQLEFHTNGAVARERALLAANQSGKTHSAAMEVAAHTTGRYPDWWKGRRFDGPVRGWAAGTSAEGTRDGVQRLLLGEGTDHGTGSIPKVCIKDVTKARGVPGGVSQIYVKHASGGESYIGFRTYEQPVERWASESLHFLWCDEEPPIAHYTEGLTRLNARQGIAFMTLTPLLGMSKTVQMFYPAPTTLDRALTMMTLDDVDHYTQDEKEAIYASYPPHEREARMLGIPMLGSGRVFPVTIESISCKPFEIPEHWPVLGGIDFGWDHPTGAVAIAWDRDADCIYVTHAYRESERTPDQISVELKSWNTGMPWTWPHDGYVHDKGSGISIADQYRRVGLRMMREHATFDNGGHGLEAGLLDMLQRMQSGRFKVFHHLEAWFSEFNIYHRKDGRVVKESDDLLSATRLCVMAKRFARTREPLHTFPVTVGADYDPLSPRAY